MNKIIQIFCIFITIISSSIIFNSCKTPEPQESDISSIVECTCNDLACWRTKTSERSWGALRCAAESGLLATGLAYAKKVKAVADSSREIVDAFDSFDVSDPTSFFASAGTELSNHVTSKNLAVQCSRETLTTISSIILFLQATLTLNSVKSRSTSDETIVEQITEEQLVAVKNDASIASYTKSAVGIEAATLASVVTCITAVSQTTVESPRIKFLTKIVKPLETLIQNLAIFYVLADCGYQLTTSTMYLLANTKCAVNDLAAVHESYKAAERTLQRLVSSQLNCNEEAKEACSVAIAQNYGVALRDKISNQSWWTYLTTGSRADQCYKYCYDRQASKELCYSLSLGKNLINYPTCQKKCAEQSGLCLDFCHSFCCDGKENCVEKVKSIIRKNKK